MNDLTIFYGCILEDSKILYLRKGNEWVLPGRKLSISEEDELYSNNLLDKIIYEQLNIDIFKLYNIYYDINDSDSNISLFKTDNNISINYIVCLPLNLKRLKSNSDIKWFSEKDLINSKDILDEDSRKLSLDVIRHFQDCNNYGEVLTKDRLLRNNDEKYL